MLLTMASARRTMRAAACGMLAFSLALALPGCARQAGDAEGDGTASSPVPSATASDGTVFTGPHAATFLHDYQSVNSDLARQILKDGKITDAEWTELQNAYAECIEGYGGTVTFNSTTGQVLEIMNSADDDRWEAKSKTADGYVTDDSTLPPTMCGVQTDFTQLSALYSDLMQYPDGYDQREEEQRIVDCLVSHGLVDEGMTVEEFEQTMQDEQRQADVFGKYFDPTRPDYDEEGDKQYMQCQDGASS